MDLTGQTYHYLTCLRRGPNTKAGHRTWICRCVCGKEVTLETGDLRDKKYPVKSCGCMKNKLLSESAKRHGMSHHPAFGVWHSMKQRCTSPTHHAWHNYGGRGITVCDRWLHSFENFWEDMGPTWQKGLDLDRIDNNKGYCPENCRWVPRIVNSNNTRHNVRINTPWGLLTIAEASRRSGIGTTTIHYRIKSG